MPTQPTYPGVYIEELPSGVRTITGVSTSDTAFVDFFPRGPIDRAVLITSYSDFERRFGGLDRRSEASYSIDQYYRNGGVRAWIVRVASPTALAAEVSIGGSSQYGGASGGSGGGGGGATIVLRAANPGQWGNSLQYGIDYNETLRANNEPVEFNLVVREVRETSSGREVVATEVFRNLSNGDRTSPRFIERVLEEESQLVRADSQSAALPQNTGPDVIEPATDGESTAFLPFGTGGDQAGSDGIQPGSPEWINSAGANAILGLPEGGEAALNTGFRLLERIAPDIFNILCIPAAAELSDSSLTSVATAATTFCRAKRAFYILDIPRRVSTVDAMNEWMLQNDTLRSDHSAIYFPRVTIPDPLDRFRPRNVGPSGSLAGIYARTDATRGVWKAPAGTDAVVAGARPAVTMTDLENGRLNPKGINGIRQFPIFGVLSWGSRTLDGADAKASEWKHIPVRRTALFIEESLYQGLKWVVFEPNDEPLWAQIRLNVGAFMQNLFRQGAFQGSTPAQAYLVKCDSETTTQNDINLGIVNVVVGFAPLKPAEFVIIKIRQLAGQIQT
jgi:phage tail sheath protein FI